MWEIRGNHSALPEVGGRRKEMVQGGKGCGDSMMLAGTGGSQGGVNSSVSRPQTFWVMTKFSETARMSGTKPLIGH